MSVYGAGTYGSAVYGPSGLNAPTIELLLNGVWTDITAYWRVNDGIQITRGKADEQQQPVSATCALTLDNTDGRFSPTNASSPYYPYLTLGTQLRVSISGSVRFWGQVYEWPVSWAVGPADTNRIVHLVANGPRRRLQRSANVGGAYFASTMARSNIVAYWPCEDGSTATTFASAISGNQVGTVVQPVTFGSDTSWVMATGGLPSMGDFSQATFPFPTFTTSAGGVGVSFALAVADPGATGHQLSVQFNTVNGGNHYFEIDYQATTDKWNVIMGDQGGGGVQFSTGLTTLGIGASRKALVNFQLKQNGTGIDYTLSQYSVANPVGIALSGTIPSATLGNLTQAVFFQGTGLTTIFGEVAVQNSALTALPVTALSGYAGETALARVTRLAAENGVSIVASGSPSTAMGAQGTGTFVSLFDDCAAADLGLSTEAVDSLAMQFRGRRDMLSTPSRLTLDLSMLSDTTTTYDDGLITNDVTVARNTGSSYRSTQMTGNRGVNTIGYYSSSVTLNLNADSQLTQPANFLLSAGTMDEPRLPVLQFDVRTTAVVASDVAAMREGDTITVTGFTQGSGVGPSLRTYLVNGWTETITVTQWIFRVVTQPHPVARGFILGSATLGILGTDRIGY